MKNTILLSALMLTASVMAFSQDNKSIRQQYETLNMRINNYTVKIDSIVSSEKKKMNEELDVIDKDFKDGKISAEEKKSHSNEIALKYETIINEKVDAQKESFEEITRERVRKSVFGKSADEKKNEMKNLLNSMDIVISGGYLNLTEKSKPFDFFNKPEEIRSGSSLSYQLRFQMQVGAYTSPVFLNFGLGVRADIYNAKKSTVFAQGNEKLFITEFTPKKLKYTQLKAEYLEIPLEMQFVLNPKYVEYDGEKFLDDSKRQWRIGAGIYGGVKIGSRIKYKYENEESSKNIFRQRVENGINPFLFGAKLSIGYAGISLYVKKDLTPIFNDDALMNNKNGLQIGLEVFNLTF